MGEKQLPVKCQICSKSMTMKQIILFIALLASTTLGAQTYYWVGGTGDWSDLSHWATTSGGSTFHTQLPGESNDVRFDENSFTAVQQVVTLDQAYQECRTLDATGVLNNPMIQGLIYTDALAVYGDLILPAAMQRDLKTIDMSGSETHTISLNGVNAGVLSFIRLSCIGNYVLGSDFSAANLYIYCDGGSFDSMGYDVYCNSRVRAFINYSVDIDFSGSDINTGEWALQWNNTYDMSNTTLTLGSALFLEVSAEGIFHPVVYIDGPTGFTSNFSCGTLEVAPGSEVQLDEGITLTANAMTLNGTNGGAVSIHSSIPGSEATFSQSTGIVNGSYLVLTDIHATGGAVFNASESVDNGNNDGWNFLVDTADNYYWVGGTGDANDLSHWATTSGGSTMHTALPGLNDPIIFDANSFSSSDDVVTFAGDVTVVSLDATGALEGATLQTAAGLGNTLTILESLNAGSLTWDVSGLYLVNSDVFDFETGLGNMPGTQLFVTGGGEVQLTGNLTINSIEVTYGGLVANGSEFTLSNAMRFLGLDVYGVLTSCNVFTSVFFAEQSIENLNLTGSELTCSVSFQMGGWEYPNVLLVDDCDISGVGYINDLMIEPGSSIHFYGGAQIVVQNSFTANGTAGNPISIDCLDEASYGSFFKESGLVEVSYLNLTNNHAEGGATFNAINSVDGGNTNGWNFIVGVEEAEATSLEVWPNPSSGQFQVATQGFEGQSLYVYDICGKQIQNSLITTTTFNLDLTQEESGAYLLLVDNNGQLVRQLLIKE